MTPKAKALNIYNRFFREVPFLQSKDSPIDDVDAAIKCALIEVDDIMEELKDISKFNESNEIKWRIIWYKSVKEEINKL